MKSVLLGCIGHTLVYRDSRQSSSVFWVKARCSVLILLYVCKECLFVPKHKDSPARWSFWASQVGSCNNTRVVQLKTRIYSRSLMTECANEFAFFGDFQKCWTECKRKLQSSYGTLNVAIQENVNSSFEDSLQGYCWKDEAMTQKYHSFTLFGTILTV